MRLQKAVIAGLAMAGIAAWSIGAARADTTLWIDDNTGVLGTVDITTHAVTVVGNTGLGGNLTDLGFTSNGNLYGTTFTGLYSINRSNAAAASLGSYNVGSRGMNGMVGNGANLLASSNLTTEIYNVSPGSPGASTNYAPSPGASAGDLAFARGSLYESIVDPHTGFDALADINSDSIIGDFSGNQSGLFGLAYDGGVMYGIAGTSIYSVNLSNGGLTFLFDYGGHGLGAANGAAVVGEGVPEPASMLLFGSALLGLGAVRRRRKRA